MQSNSINSSNNNQSFGALRMGKNLGVRGLTFDTAAGKGYSKLHEMLGNDVLILSADEQIALGRTKGQKRIALLGDFIQKAKTVTKEEFQQAQAQIMAATSQIKAASKNLRAELLG